MPLKSLPIVSVIMPCYNSSKYLSAALKSVFAQTLQSFEIIVIDDGSDIPLTEKRVPELRDLRVKLIRLETNQGLSAARNEGINNAVGKYVSLLDDDDLWLPQKLEKEVAYLEKYPEIGLLHSWAACVTEQGTLTGVLLVSTLGGWCGEAFLTAPHLSVCALLIRKTCFDRLGGFNPTFRCVEDWEMWTRITKVYQIDYLPEFVALYRVRQGSLSKDLPAMEQNFRRLIEANFQHVSSELMELKKQAYANTYVYLAWQALNIDEGDATLALHYHAIARSYCSNTSRNGKILFQRFVIFVKTYIRVNHQDLTIRSKWLVFLIVRLTNIFSKPPIPIKQLQRDAKLVEKI